jgi:hypothetical protein
MATLVVRVDLRAPQQRVWDALTDWDGQGSWMLLTRVRGTVKGGQGLGGGIEAWTGVGPVGFLDTMEITQWQPPRRVAVVHTGHLVKGTAAFDVMDLGRGRSRLAWTEEIDLPFGVFGRVAWVITAPLVRLGVRYSLRRFVAEVERAESGRDAMSP